MIETNPRALDIAAALDRERRAQGPRGPLHGMPILIKDNIETADRMMTTAGSLALEGWYAPEDAPLVARLRAAGAVHSRQDQPERMGQLPLDAFDQWLERAAAARPAIPMP